jgi:hypothetical protein
MKNNQVQLPSTCTNLEFLNSWGNSGTPILGYWETKSPKKNENPRVSKDFIPH